VLRKRVSRYRQSLAKDPTGMRSKMEQVVEEEVSLPFSLEAV
jgi:hypothetical protein